MTRKRYGRIAALVLTASMAAGLFADAGPGTVLAAGEAEETASPVTEAFSIERLTSNYTNVSAGYTAADYRGEAKVFRIGEITDEAGADMLTEDNYGCEFPYKSRVMGTSEPLKPLKAPYMARNPVKWGFFRLKRLEIPLKI